MHSLIHDTGAGFWLGHSLMVLLMIAVLALALTGAYLLLSALLERRETGRDETDREEPLRRHDRSLPSNDGKVYAFSCVTGNVRQMQAPIDSVQ